MRTRISSLATALTLGVLALAAPPVADVGDVGLAGYKYVPEPTATLERATDIVVDDAHGQVFVAQTDAGLLVTDPDGSPVETIGMPDIGVSAKVKSVMRSGHAVHGVRVHHLDEPAVIAAKVLPDHAGDCIVFDVEVLAGGHWHDAFAKCVRANDDSAAALGLRGARQITGLKFRVRGIFRGDRDNDSAHGQWHYFKFVR